MLPVLVDSKADVAVVAAPLLDHAHGKTPDTLPVSGGAALHLAVRAIVSKARSVECVLNLCDGDDAAGGVSAQTAAVLLEQCRVPYSGCRAQLLARHLDVLFMMAMYAGVPMPVFAVVATPDDAPAAARLDGALRVRHALPFVDTWTAAVPADSTTRTDTLRSAAAAHGRLVVWQDRLAGGGNTPGAAVVVVHVLVSGGATRGALAVAAETPLDTATEALVRQWAAAFSKKVLYDCGLALLTLAAAEASVRDWRLADVVLNPSLASLPAALRAAVDTAALLRDALADAQAASPRLNYELHLNEDSRKGYSLRATRDIRERELIFDDECRSFAMVTRPHVEANWDSDQKKMFTEYAWPLDSDGHLYAIWEEEPTRWRPINHSCDPTCIFAAPHSLNMIAARDIQAGEELSADYATFCDSTMRPFDCLCGAATCRGRVVVDAAALGKYGEHAWLRRVPPARPLL